jgi:hypothetical protein
MEATTKTGCDFVDTFRILRLTVPREHTGDTFVTQGDTLQLFAQATGPDATNQWWSDPSEQYYNSMIHDRILDLNGGGAKSRGDHNYDSIASFIGDTLPLRTYPTSFRGDTVDMILNSEATFAEHNNYVCLVRDTVAIAVITGFKIEGMISYSSSSNNDEENNENARVNWNPGASWATHRPIGCVTLYLYEGRGFKADGSFEDGILIDSTLSNLEGRYSFFGRYPAGVYTVEGKAADKKVLDARGALYASDAELALKYANFATVEHYPWKLADDIWRNPKAMIYKAADVDEKVSFGVLDLEGMDAYLNIYADDATLILNRSLGPDAGWDQEIVSKEREDWLFSIEKIDLFEDKDSIHVYGVMRGDVDMTYGADGIDTSQFGCNPDATPMRLATRTFTLKDTLYVNSSDEYINLPIIATKSGSVTSFQEHMEIPTRDMEVLAVTSPNNKRTMMAHYITGNKVNLAWIDLQGGMDIQEGDVLANMIVKVKRKRSLKKLPNEIKYLETAHEIGINSRKADSTFGVALPHIIIDNDMPITILDSIMEEEEEIIDTFTPDKEIVPMVVLPAADIQASKIVTVIPNPVVDRSTDVTYSIAEEAVVTMKLFNLLGVEVEIVLDGERQNVGVFRKKIITDHIPDGIYILRLEASSETRRDISVEKIVVNR